MLSIPSLWLWTGLEFLFIGLFWWVVKKVSSSWLLDCDFCLIPWACYFMLYWCLVTHKCSGFKASVSLNPNAQGRMFPFFNWWSYSKDLLIEWLVDCGIGMIWFFFFFFYFLFLVCLSDFHKFGLLFQVNFLFLCCPFLSLLRTSRIPEPLPPYFVFSFSYIIPILSK